MDKFHQHTLCQQVWIIRVGPEHSWMERFKKGLIMFRQTDGEAMEAFHLLTKLEGIIPAWESSHAVAYAMKLAKKIGDSRTILVNLFGEGR